MASKKAIAPEAPSVAVGRILLSELDERTKAQRERWKHDSLNRRKRGEATLNLNSNGNSETNDQSIGELETLRADGTLCRGDTRQKIPQSMATGDLRDIVIFASKQIYERGFEMLQYCFYDFRLDVVAVAALANLFKDVDIDRDGRLGINDISLWISAQDGSFDSKAAAEAIKNIKGEGGFLSKLDFVRLILEREMALKEEEEEDKNKLEEAWRLRVASEDLLWAVFIAMDANRDGWISKEDFRRLCRPMKYELSDMEEKVLCGGSGRSGGGGGGGGGVIGVGGVGLLNFREFQSFVETGKIEKERKRKFCVIQ